MRVASQPERSIINLKVILGVAFQGYLSSSSPYIYILYIAVGEDLILDVICWNSQKELTIWTLRYSVLICIISVALVPLILEVCNASVTHSNINPFTIVVTIGTFTFLHKSHYKLHLYNEQDSVAEWSSRLGAIRIPMGAQDRVLSLSFGCYCSDFTGVIKYVRISSLDSNSRYKAVSVFSSTIGRLGIWRRCYVQRDLTAAESIFP